MPLTVTRIEMKITLVVLKTVTIMRKVVNNYQVAFHTVVNRAISSKHSCSNNNKIKLKTKNYAIEV